MNYRTQDLWEIVMDDGFTLQQRIAIEKMAELTGAIARDWECSTNSTTNELMEKMADAMLALESLMLIFHCKERVENIVERKIMLRMDSIILKNRSMEMMQDVNRSRKCCLRKDENP